MKLQRYASLVFCVLLTVVCTLPSLLLLSLGDLWTPASYKDFILADIAQSGYNKKLELHAIILFIFCDFLVLPLLLWQRRKIISCCKKQIDKYRYIFIPISHGINKLLPFFQSPIFNVKTSIFSMVLFVFIYLLLQIGTIKSWGEALAFSSVFGTYLLLILILRRRPELFIHSCMSGIGSYFSLMGLLVAWGPPATLFNWARLWAIPVTCLATLRLAYWLHDNTEASPAKVVALAWTLVPCLLMALTRYGYISNDGAPVELYTSWFSGIFFASFVLTIVICNLFLFLRRQYTTVYAISAASIALYFSWHAPSPFIPNDFFHIGEMTVPLQQWLEFGKRPFIDYHPVHGICDYYYFALSHLFFDGTYSSFNAGIAVGRSLQAVLQILVLAVACKNKYVVLLLAIFLPDLGVRWLAAGLCLPLSFWLFRRWGTGWFLLWSCISGLFSIFWNVPQGAAYCASLTPLIVSKFWKERKDLHLPTPAQMAIAVLLCVGLVFIWPYLESLVANTLLTSQLAVEAFGRPVPDGIRSAHWRYTLCAWLFLPFLAALYIRAAVSRGKSGLATLLPISLTFFCLVCINYAFLRYDEGSRARTMSLFLIVASLPALGVSRSFFRVLNCSFLGVALLLPSIYVFHPSYRLMYENQVYTCPKDFTLVSDADLKHIPNLGRGFIDPATLDELLEFREYLAKNGNRYADIDYSLARYCIFNTEDYLKYQTAVNTEGTVKQDDSLNRIENNELNLILLPLQCDRATRSQLYYFQIQLFKRGFYPDAILSNKYLILKRRAKDSPGPAPTRVSLPAAGIRDLAYLPQAWSSACASLTQPVPVSYGLTLKNCIRTENGNFVSEKGGTVVMELHFAKPVSARDFQFLLFSSRAAMKRHQARVISPDIADGNDGYSFWLGERTAAVPIFLDYTWLYSTKLMEISLEISDIPAGEPFSIEIGFLGFRHE